MANLETTVNVTLESVLAQYMSNAGQAHAVADVIIERHRQDAKWGGPEHDDRHDAMDWREFIRHQLDAVPYESNKAMDHEEYDAVVRQRFVKIAALAAAAIESLDRQVKRNAEA